MWMLPSQLKDFAQSLVAVVFFGSNILFWRESGYFAADAELMPLLHTWSLAVEEQYYIVFPIFLLLAWRFGRNKVFWSVVVIAAISLLLSEWGGRNKPSANFYLAPTRAWELLAGSICAFLTVGRTLKSNNVLSAVGLAAIVVSIFAFDDNTPFPSVYALVPVVGTALIILFGRHGTWVAKLLSMRVFVGIGLISYSSYLWHQPLFAFARLRSLTEPSHVLMAGLAVAALLLAWGTWRWVEQPFRKSANPVLVTRRSVFAASGAVGAVFVALGLVGHFGNGFEWRGSGLANLDQRVMVNHGLHTDCEGAFNDSRNCSTSITPNVLLWGDSFAMHLAQGIIASEDNVALQQHTMSVCTPVLGIAVVNGKYKEDWAQKCLEFNEQVISWLREQDSVELVILSSPFSQLLGESVSLDNGELMLDPNVRFVADRILNTAQKIRETGARVIIVSPTPRSGRDNGQCLMRSVYYGMNEASCNFALDTDEERFELLRSVADNVAVYWLHEDFCENGTCDALKDNIFIYRDGGHLSKEGSAYLGRTNHWLENFRLMAN
jgi:hypothetical protein